MQGKRKETKRKETKTKTTTTKIDPIQYHQRYHPGSSLQRTPIQSLQQLRPISKHSGRLRIPNPLAFPFMHLRPISLLPIHRSLEELIQGLCARRPHLLDQPEVLAQGANHSRLLPRLSTGRILSCLFVRLPSSLWKYPASRATGLDHQDLCGVGRQRDQSGHQSFAFGTVAYKRGRVLLKKIKMKDRRWLDSRWFFRPVRASIDRLCSTIIMQVSYRYDRLTRYRRLNRRESRERMDWR